MKYANEHHSSEWCFYCTFYGYFSGLYCKFVAHIMEYDCSIGGYIMYIITATQDFVDMLQEIPIRYLLLLTSSFISIEKCQEDTLKEPDNTFILDLLEQIRNEELE